MNTPAWAANIPDNVRAELLDHDGYVLRHLHFYVNHPQRTFDVTFYDREPILEVKLDAQWARKVQACVLAEDRARFERLLRRIAFTDGTVAAFGAIWCVNYMPADLDISDVDMGMAEEVIGLGGETLREMIRRTYRCATRKEEDFFIARWIAS